MLIYAAGSSAERATIAARLESAGHTITHKWWPDVDAAMAAGKTDRDLTEHERLHHACADLRNGIELADVFWLLWPSTPSKGAFVELGYALAWERGQLGVNHQVLVSGDHRACIFTALATHRFGTHEEACAYLLEGGR